MGSTIAVFLIIFMVIIMIITGQRKRGLLLMEKTSKSAKIYLALVFIILYAPIFYLIFYSFNSGGTMNDFESFTWEHYAAVFSDTRLIMILNKHSYCCITFCINSNDYWCIRCTWNRLYAK